MNECDKHTFDFTFVSCEVVATCVECGYKVIGMDIEMMQLGTHERR